MLKTKTEFELMFEFYGCMTFSQAAKALVSPNILKNVL